MIVTRNFRTPGFAQCKNYDCFEVAGRGVQNNKAEPDLDVAAHLLAGVIAPAQEQSRIQNNPVAGQQRNIVSFNRHYNTHGQRQLTALRSVTLKWLLEIVGPLRETANLCMATGTVALQPGR